MYVTSHITNIAKWEIWKCQRCDVNHQRCDRSHDRPLMRVQTLDMSQIGDALLQSLRIRGVGGVGGVGGERVIIPVSIENDRLAIKHRLSGN
jgi:hypothetical protein